jgi:hypothetical protein
MDLWVYGWNWGWMAVALIWVVVLTAAFVALIRLTDRHTRRLR